MTQNFIVDSNKAPKKDGPANHQAPANKDAALLANSSKQFWILLPQTKRQTWKIAQSTRIGVCGVGNCEDCTETEPTLAFLSLGPYQQVQLL